MTIWSGPPLKAFRYEVADHVAEVTIHRPERRNALDIAAYAEIERIFDAIRHNPDIRCVLLTGADPAFCSGEDVQALMGRTAEEVDADRSAILHQPAFTPVVRYPATPPAISVLDCEVPLVVAVNGAAVGWGMELALFGDIRLASDKARFSEIFVKRGLIPDVAGFARLPAIVGPSKAAELMFTGDVIDAAEALRIGLVSDVLPHDALMPVARAMAQRIAANPPLSLRFIKEGLRRWVHPDPHAIGGWCNAAQDRLRLSDDHHEGVQSFLDKRAPVFVGR